MLSRWVPTSTAVVVAVALVVVPGSLSMPAQSLDALPILFQTDRAGSSDIFAMDATGRRQAPIVPGPANDEDAAWAPGSLAFAFSSDRDGTWQIYLRDARGEVRQLTKGRFSNIDPAWSRDGRRIAFETNRNGNWDIYVMNADGSEQQNVSRSGANEFDPAWHPREERVAFSRVLRGRADLYAATLPGGAIERLTTTPEPEFEPAFSPRGTRIAFSRVVNRNSDIYVMTVPGGRTIRLTRSPTIDADPVWVSDESAVLFTSARPDGDLEVYRVTVVGRQLTNLSNRHGVNDSEADWRPGATAAFAVGATGVVRTPSTHGPPFLCGAAASVSTVGPFSVRSGGSGADRLCSGGGRQWLRGYASLDKEAAGTENDRLEGGINSNDPGQGDLLKAHDGFRDVVYGGTITKVAADGYTVTAHVDQNLNDAAWLDKNLDVTYGIDKPNF